MVTADQNLFVHQGSNTEDNATKDLQWLLTNAPWSATQRVLEPVFEQANLSGELVESEPATIDIRTQVGSAEAGEPAETAALIGLAPQGGEYENVAVSEFEPDADPERHRRLDMVVDIGESMTIGIEAKLGDFNGAQLRDHARELEADVFGVVTWHDLLEAFEAAAESVRGGPAISESPLAVPTTERLFSQYQEFLQLELVSITETLGTSSWSSGENVIEIVRHVDNDKLNHRAVDPDEEPLPVPVALRFQSRPHGADNGPSLYFSPEEWTQLIDELDQDFVENGFAKGTTAPMQERYEESEQEYISLARISDSDGNAKYIRYGAPKSRDLTSPTIYMNKDTADGGNLLGDIPMYGDDNIREMFGPDSALTRLFTSPDNVFKSL